MALQDLRNRADADEANTKFVLDQGNLHATFQARQGKDAADHFDSYSKESQDLRVKGGAGLNPEARRMYDSESRGYMQRNIFSAATYAAGQNKHYLNETSKSKVDMLINQVLLNPNDENMYKEGLEKVANEAYNQVELSGMDDPDGVAKAELGGMYQSKIVAARVNGTLKTNAPLAQKMLDEAKKNGTIRGDDALKIEPAIRQNLQRQASRSASDNVNSDFPPYLVPQQRDRTIGIDSQMLNVYRLAARNHPELEFAPGVQPGRKPGDRNKRGLSIDLIPLVNGKEAPEGDQAPIQKAMEEAAKQLATPMTSENGHYTITPPPGGEFGVSAGLMSVLDAVRHAEVNHPWKDGERSGYTETVSGQHFKPENFPDSHPYEHAGFRYFHGRHGLSSASGAYQETLTTYRDNVRAYGIRGMTEAAQTQRAAMKASDLYKSTGAWRNFPDATGDLEADAERFGGDPGWWRQAVAPALHREWTSVPGGLEPNDKTRNWIQNAVDRFNDASKGEQPKSLPPQTEGERIERAVRYVKEKYPDDPDLPDLARDRVMTDFNRAKSIKQNQDYTDRNAMLEGVHSPRPDGTLPTSIEEVTAMDPKFAAAWERMDAIHRQPFYSAIALNAKGDRNWDNDSIKLYQRIMAMSMGDGDRAGFLDVDPTSLKLPIRGKLAIANAQNQVLAKSTVDPRMGHAMDTVNDILGEQGISKTTRKDDWYQIRGAMQDAMQDYQAIHKVPMKDDEVRKMAKRMIGQVPLTEAWDKFWSFSGQDWFFRMSVPQEEVDMLRANPKFKDLDDKEIQRLYVRYQYLKLYEKGKEGAEERPRTGGSLRTATEEQVEEGLKAQIKAATDVVPAGPVKE
jgi:hypothetical protein